MYWEEWIKMRWVIILEVPTELVKKQFQCIRQDNLTKELAKKTEAVRFQRHLKGRTDRT